MTTMRARTHAKGAKTAIPEKMRSHALLQKEKIKEEDNE